MVVACMRHRQPRIKILLHFAIAVAFDTEAAGSTHLALLLDAELLGHKVGDEGLEESKVNGCSNRGGKEERSMGRGRNQTVAVPLASCALCDSHQTPAKRDSRPPTHKRLRRQARTHGAAEDDHHVKQGAEGVVVAGHIGQKDLGQPLALQALGEGQEGGGGQPAGRQIFNKRRVDSCQSVTATIVRGRKEAEAGLQAGRYSTREGWIVASQSLQQL